jgi:regulatory protein
MTLADFKKAAINWLSRREHSRIELSRKLQQKGADSDQQAAVTDWCLQQGYLDEQRFLEMLLRHRSQQGYGLQYILRESQLHQFSAAQVIAMAEQLEIDWWALAAQAYQKKFAAKAPGDYQEKLKRMAYLQRRGFSSEQIRAALSEARLTD